MTVMLLSPRQNKANKALTFFPLLVSWTLSLQDTRPFLNHLEIKSNQISSMEGLPLVPVHNPPHNTLSEGFFLAPTQSCS